MEPTCLQRAAQAGDVQGLQKAIATLHEGIDATSGNLHFTALHTAARGGHLECVAALLAAGASAHAKARFGATPLYFAVIQGALPCVEALLAAGSRVDVAVGRGRTTPLIVAVRLQRLHEEEEAAAHFHAVLSRWLDEASSDGSD